HTLKPRSWPSRPIRSSIACSCCQGFGSVARKSATSSGVLKSSTTLLLCRCPDPFACDELGVGALFIWGLGCRPRRAVVPQHDPRAAGHRPSVVRPPVRQPKTRRQTRRGTPPTTGLRPSNPRAAGSAGSPARRTPSPAAPPARTPPATRPGSYAPTTTTSSRPHAPTSRRPAVTSHRKVERHHEHPPRKPPVGVVPGRRGGTGREPPRAAARTGRHQARADIGPGAVHARRSG